MKKTEIIICGAGGRMGSLILSLAAQRGEFKIAGAVERTGHPLVGKEVAGVKVSDDLSAVAQGTQVIIDFTAAEAATANLKTALAAKNPVVIGTTGLTPAQRNEITAAAEKIPVLLAANTSFGVNCFFEIVKRAARLLGDSDIEVTEIHHNRKKDAPSGTAKEIAAIICRETGRDPESALRYGREGLTGERTKEEIGVHALRLGDVVGEHSVFFGGRGEIIELTHRCYNREAFASGALEAAKFLAGKPAGLYTMKDLINGGKKDA